MPIVPPLLADLFLYSYDAEFIEKCLREKNKSCFIGVVLTVGEQIHSYVDPIYPGELEIKDTTESSNFASYLDISLKIYTGGKVTIQLYDKRDDLNFCYCQLPILYISSIPLSPAYAVYLSHLIRYARVCSAYDQFLSRVRLLTEKLMLQGFLQSRLMSAFLKFYGRYNDIICDEPNV
jgi:hypothetical protein